MKINCTPYPINLTVLCDKHQFIKAYKKLKGYEPDLEGCNGYTAFNGNTLLVGVFDRPLLTLVHELNHTCLYIFDYIGLPINSTNSEAYCYYMDSLLKQSLPCIGYVP